MNPFLFSVSADPVNNPLYLRCIFSTCWCDKRNKLSSLSISLISVTYYCKCSIFYFSSWRSCHVQGSCSGDSAMSTYLFCSIQFAFIRARFTVSCTNLVGVLLDFNTVCICADYSLCSHCELFIIYCIMFILTQTLGKGFL